MSQLPAYVRDFIFDLHEATRFSKRSEDLQNLYEVRYREMIEKHFQNAPFPDVSKVSNECRNDEAFLLFYREMALRHLFTCQKIKQTISDHIDSWNNYINLFEYIISTAENPDIALTTQWANDIIQEFVYQFQGFCQYRTQVQNRNADDIRTLEANRSVWNLPKVMQILKSLTKIAQIDIPSGGESRTGILHNDLGMFAAVELVRLHCLVGDYTSALKAAAPLLRNDPMELLAAAPSSLATLFYHAGVSSLMIRRYSDALSTFSDVILHVHRVMKLGNDQTRQGSQSQIQKTMDKILVLAAIATALCPGVRVDDQVRELIDGKGSRKDEQARELQEGKWAERLRRLNDGDITTFSDLFEQNCPKFISPAVPDYSVSANLNAEAFSTPVSVFKEEVHQHFSVLKIRSYLRLYASIDVSKLARFNEVSENVFISQLISFKHKSTQIQTSAEGVEERVSVSDVSYFIQGSDLVIDTSNAKSEKLMAIERHFASGIRKHGEMKGNLVRYFAKHGM